MSAGFPLRGQGESNRISRTFRDAAERMDLQTGAPFRTMSDDIVPVVQVASPMFSDTERSLYLGGGEQTPPSNRRGSVGLVCNVPTLLFAAIPTTALYNIFTMNAVSFDPFDGGFGDNLPNVRPFGHIGKNVVRQGRSNSVQTNQGATTGGLNGILIGGERPLYLDAGVTLVLQARADGVAAVATFAWSELE